MKKMIQMYKIAIYDIDIKLRLGLTSLQANEK